MNLIRILIILAVIWLAWRVLKGYLASKPVSEAKPMTRDKQPESMVRCAQCGVYLPTSRAARQGDQWRCPEHQAHD